ncbi:MAG: tRNA-intron lyase [Candidatus Altiarchaeota archaeon]|nr:tRNA-intron lyase [Candidatus Altiarchaeota archaeon]
MLKERGFGEKLGEGWRLFPEEALFLVEDGYLEVVHRKKALLPEQLRKKFERKNRGFLARYLVYKDLRNKGYLLKAGLKYGVDFRVYEKGVKPRVGSRNPEEHAKFLLWILDETSPLSPTNLIGMNRVAHSVKKYLWVAIVDRDLGITYTQMSRVVP